MNWCWQMLWGEWLRRMFLAALLLLLALPLRAQTTGLLAPVITASADKQHYGHGENASITVLVKNPNPPSTHATPLLCSVSLTYTDPILGIQTVGTSVTIAVGNEKDNAIHKASLALSYPGLAAPISATIGDLDGGQSVTQVVSVPLP